MIISPNLKGKVALVTARKRRPAVQAFLAALSTGEARAALERAGFRPA